MAPRIVRKRMRTGQLCVALALLALGCNGVPTKDKRTAQAQEPTKQSSGAAEKSANPSWDLNCVFERIQNPPDSFHYTYKHNESSWEADVTPDSIEGARKAPDGVRPIHGVRSDADSWHQAWMNLSAISGMSSTFALVRSGESTLRDRVEPVNGFDTIRYSVDTTRANSVESGLYRATLGPGGLEKGTVWVTSQGCPVKFVIDVEMHMSDGRIERDHYEEAMIRK